MPIFTVRNDDINRLDDELVAVSRRCTEAGVPITHAVEPANLSDEAAAWLRDEKARDPRLLGIMQHGYDHRKRDVGEFGGRRPYADQKRDLSRGLEIMREAFGPDLDPAVNFPFGPYNAGSIRAVDELGFRVLNSHYNCRPSRRAFYAAGRLLRRGRLLDRHVSWHLRDYPRTGLFCIDMALSFISRYTGPYGSVDCEFNTAATLVEQARRFARHTPVIGVVLHHRYHVTPASLDLITETLDGLRSAFPDAEFLNFAEIHARLRPGAPWGFRDA